MREITGKPEPCAVCGKEGLWGNFGDGINSDVMRIKPKFIWVPLCPVCSDGDYIKFKPIRCNWCQDRGWVPADGPGEFPCTECGGGFV